MSTEEQKHIIFADIERVKEIRADGTGVFEARNIALKEALHAAINEARDMDDIKAILRSIVRDMLPTKW